MTYARFVHATDRSIRLRCPVCSAGAIVIDRDSAHCDSESCAATYTVVNEVPVLLNESRSVFRRADFAGRANTTFSAAGSFAERVGRMLPSPSRDIGRRQNYRRLANALRARSPEARQVLVVGCGDGSSSYLEVSKVDGATILETDVSLAGNAKIVCDATDLPFESHSFDLVICQAVLEHVLEPQRCVDEMHRVLKCGGLIYATTPFMQHVHMGAFDFTRFTYSGHRWLFRWFSQIDAGIANGPGSMLVWSIENFLLAWTDRVAARRMLKALTRLSLGWLTMLDFPLARFRSAVDASGGFYFIGERSSTQVFFARDVVEYYRGADATK